MCPAKKSDPTRYSRTGRDPEAIKGVGIATIATVSVIWRFYREKVLQIVPDVLSVKSKMLFTTMTLDNNVVDFI